RLAVCGNHGHLTANQIGRQCWQTSVVTFGPAVFDRYVPTLDIAVFCQPLPKRGQEVCILLGRPGIQKSNHRQCRLLRARRERPRGRTAEERDELASLYHSITSSARVTSEGGISMPSALAVFRLIVRSTLVGNSIGRSFGLAPFRILST